MLRNIPRVSAVEMLHQDWYSIDSEHATLQTATHKKSYQTSFKFNIMASFGTHAIRQLGDVMMDVSGGN